MISNICHASLYNYYTCLWHPDWRRPIRRPTVTVGRSASVGRWSPATRSYGLNYSTASWQRPISSPWATRGEDFFLSRHHVWRTQLIFSPSVLYTSGCPPFPPALTTPSFLPPFRRLGHMFSYLSRYCTYIWCGACLWVSFQVYPRLAPFLSCLQALFTVCVHTDWVAV